jgi:DUF917 family protein
MVRILSYKEAMDMVTGAHILATGGGGDFTQAITKIKQIYSTKMQFKIQNITDFEPDDMVCIVGEVGGGISPEDAKYVNRLEKSIENPMVEAVHELEEHLGVNFAGFVSTEMGPGNLVVPFVVGSRLNRVVIDGDMCGRSKPMISISTTRIADISITPLAMISKYGDKVILKKSVSDNRAEDICRTISRISDGSIGVTRCPMTINDAKRAVINGSISEAIRLGKGVRKANEKKEDVIPVIEKEANAKLICIGKVKEFNRLEEGGFTSGTIVIKSNGSFLRIWYKNEYLLSWMNEQPFISCPDSILIVNRITGQGLSLWTEDFYQKNIDVAVFFKPSAPIWQTKKGLEIFGPQVFDLNWKYKSYNGKTTI